MAWVVAAGSVLAGLAVDDITATVVRTVRCPRDGGNRRRMAAMRCAAQNLAQVSAGRFHVQAEPIGSPKSSHMHSRNLSI